MFKKRKLKHRKNPILNKKAPILLDQQIFKKIDEIERTLLKFRAVNELYTDGFIANSCEKVFSYYNTFLYYFESDLIKIYNPKFDSYQMNTDLTSFQENIDAIFYTLYKFKKFYIPEETSEEATEHLRPKLKRLTELSNILNDQYKIFFEEIKKCKKLTRKY